MEELRALHTEGVLKDELCDEASDGYPSRGRSRGMITQAQRARTALQEENVWRTKAVKQLQDWIASKWQFQHFWFLWSLVTIQADEIRF